MKSAIALVLLLSASPAAVSQEYDFGPHGSAVEKDTTAVSENTAYTPERGYGWVGNPKLETRDRGFIDAFRRDFIYGNDPAEFRIDLPNQWYRITIFTGDNTAGNHVLTVQAEGNTVVEKLQPQVNKMIEYTFSTRVTDGHLDLRFSSPDRNWVVNGLRVRAASGFREAVVQEATRWKTTSIPPPAPLPHTDRLRVIKQPHYSAKSYPSSTDYMRILERFPLYSERGWHPDFMDNPSVGYFGDKDHGEMGLRAMGNYIFVTALLATDPTYDPKPSGVSKATLMARARACLAYMTRAHVTGDLHCADGLQWGNAWQSAWWTARMAAGARILWLYLSADEKAAVERVIVHEANRHLSRKPPSGASSDTKSEENAWDSEVLAWAVGMFPKHEKTPEWTQKLKEFTMNTLSAPQDRKDERLVDGKPVKDWVVTENIHEDYTIENHGAYHFCYMACPLHSIAWGYEGLRGADIPVPEAMFHHYQDVWRWIKRTSIGDGRFAYLSGKDWPRYSYGLSFVLPVTVLAQIQFNDADARRLERDRIALLEREQILNADGSFYGGRYTRNILGHRPAEYETDTYANIALCYLLHKHHKTLPPTDPDKLRKYLVGTWSSPDSGWVMGRSPELFTSFSWRCLHGIKPVGLFIPSGCEHMAEWMPGQLVGRIDVEGDDLRRAKLRHNEHQFPFGYSTTGEIGRCDAAGKLLLKQQVSFTVLLQEGVAVVLERSVAEVPVTIKHSEEVNLALANDIFNNSVRKIQAGERTVNLTGAKNLGTVEAARAEANAVSERLVPVASNWLCIDGKLGVALPGGNNRFVIHDVSGRNAPWGSLQYEIISANPQGERKLSPGQVALDSAFALVQGDRSAVNRLHQRCTTGVVENMGGVRWALVEAPSGKLYLITANLDGTPRSARISIPVEPPSRSLRYTADPVRRNGKWWLETQLEFHGFDTEVRQVGKRE